MSAIIIPRKSLVQPQGRVQISPEWEGPLAGVLVPGLPPLSHPAAFPVSGVQAAGVSTFGQSIRTGSAGLVMSSAHGSWLSDVTIFALYEGGTNGKFIGQRAGAGYVFGVDAGYVLFIEFGVADRSVAKAHVTGGMHTASINVSPNAAGSIISDGVVLSEFTSGAFSAPAGNVGVLCWWDGYVRDPITTRGVGLVAVLRGNNKAMAQELHRAPWQLFRADPIRIYSLPSGPITLGTPRFLRVTSSGFGVELDLS